MIEAHSGPDTDESKECAEQVRQENEALKARSGDASALVAQLHAVRLPMPTTGTTTGKLILALERAGLFRAGGFLAGTHSSGLYALELGVRLAHALAQTDDKDAAADREVDVIAAERTSLTNSLDGIGLRPVAGSMEAHPVRWDTEDGVLDILAPRRRGASWASCTTAPAPGLSRGRS